MLAIKGWLLAVVAAVLVVQCSCATLGERSALECPELRAKYTRLALEHKIRSRERSRSDVFLEETEKKSPNHLGAAYVARPANHTLAPVDHKQELSCLEEISRLIPANSRVRKLVSKSPEDYCKTWDAIECDEEFSVTRLLLRNAGLESLPGCFKQLPRVVYVDFEDNKLKEVPPAIADMPDLQSIDLEANQLTSVPAEIGNLKHLLFFDMDKNKIPEVPGTLSNLASLEEVDWSSVELKELPNLDKWQNIGDLFLDDNKIESLPDSFGYMSKLRFCVLENNLLKSLPSSIGNLRSLKRLHLANNQLTRIPYSIGKLKWMYELDISGNQIEKLPHSIGHASRLKLIFADDNQLTRVPSSIANLLNLKVISLAGNNLTTIPTSWGRIASLKELNLSENMIDKLPSRLSSKNSALAKTVKKLYLAGNRLTNFDKEARAFNALSELDLSRNRLRSLPSWMSTMTELEVLSVSHNANLTSIPDSLVLPSLRVLDISFTNIQETPLFLMKSPKLEEVHMSGVDLPRTKKNMERAEKLAKWSQKVGNNVFRMSQDPRHQAGNKMCKDVEYRQAKSWRILIDTNDCHCEEKYMQIKKEGGEFECVACPKHAECRGHAVYCREGFYMDKENVETLAAGGVIECKRCPYGAFCDDHTDYRTLKMLPGFWRASNQTDEVLECHNHMACRGDVDADGSPIDLSTSRKRKLELSTLNFDLNMAEGSEGEEETGDLDDGHCESGYMGPVCAVCKDGYFSSGRYGCTKCPPLVYTLSWTVFLNVFGTTGLLWLLYRSESVMLVKIIIQFTQMTTSLNDTYDVNWPSEFREFADFLGFVNFDFVKVSSAECLFRHGGGDTFNFYHSLALMSVAPLFFCGMIGIFYLLARVFYYMVPYRLPKEGLVSLYSGCIKMGVLVLIFMYLPVSFKAMKAFKCHNIEGEMYLMADYRLRCYDSSWWAYIWISVLTLFVYTIGVPAFCVIYMGCNRAKLSSEWMLVQFGAVYKYYKGDYFWYYFFDLYRCLLVGGAAMFFSDVEAYNLSISIFITFLAFTLHVGLRPFVLWMDNFVQAASLFLLMATMCLGTMRLLMVPDRDYQRACVMVIFCNIMMVSVLVFRYGLVLLKIIGRIRAKIKYTIDNRRKAGRLTSGLTGE